MDTQTVKIEHDVLTGEVTERPLTSEELAQLEIDLQAETARLAAESQAVLAKEAAQAKLAALGLTTDDLKALGL